MKAVIFSKKKRFATSAVLSIAIALVAISAFGIGSGRSEPIGGGGGGSCPTPYGPSEHIWWDMASVGSTSASITFDLSSSSAMDIALATLTWWSLDSIAPGGSIGNIGIGEGSGTTETMTGMYGWVEYSFDIVASITCTDSTGTHSYWGEATGNFNTARMTDWMSVLASGKIVAVDSVDTGVTCTMAENANFTIQSVNTESSGTWSITSGPTKYGYAGSVSITPSSAVGAGAACDLYAAGTITNPSVSTVNICNPNCGSGGVVIGYTFSWDPLYLLTFDPVGGNPVSLSVTIDFVFNYYFNPGTSGTVTETCASVSIDNVFTEADILLTVAHVALFVVTAS